MGIVEAAATATAFLESSLTRQLLQAYLGTPEGKLAFQQLVNASATSYPQYWAELEGIVEGSGIPRELVCLPSARSRHTS